MDWRMDFGVEVSWMPFNEAMTTCKYQQELIRTRRALVVALLKGYSFRQQYIYF